MDQKLRDAIEREAEKHALYNALKHEADANVGAIMGPLMAENPHFRSHGDEITGIVTPIVERINDLDHAMRRDRLATISPELVSTLETHDDQTQEPALPDLPHTDDYDEIRLRCAPNPNGPWHVGNARMAAVIGTYKERYDGWMLCRFDDTDPETKRPDLTAYDLILEDISYLGFDVDEVVYASDRLELYYDHARTLITTGSAYTCSCSASSFSALKNNATPCPHRKKDISMSTTEFEEMVDGTYVGGEMVLRIRTDISHKNPALRDWVGFRIVDSPHPRPEAAQYRCWPMLDFQSAIDDHVMNITHIIRGKDLQDSAGRQQYVYNALEWEYPEVVHWGKIQVDEYEVRMSTSTIKELIEAGELDGWDDPRAPTLRSLARRGIKGDAITAALIELGMSTSDVDLSMSSIYAKNRELIDVDADRYFLVRDGIRKELVGQTPPVAMPPRHPDAEERGHRELPVGRSVLLEPDDIPANGGRVWLKGLGCVRHIRDAFEVTGEDIDVVREEDVDVVHWVPAEVNRQVTVRTVSGSFDGRAEPDFEDEPVGNVVQFERVGFARVDEHGPHTSVAFFGHR